MQAGRGASGTPPPTAEVHGRAEVRRSLQARTAAVRDAAIRKACLPYIEQLRPLYPHGTEVRTRRDWRLFQWMMQTFGPRFTLWAASLQRK